MRQRFVGSAEAAGALRAGYQFLTDQPDVYFMGFIVNPGPMLGVSVWNPPGGTSYRHFTDRVEQEWEGLGAPMDDGYMGSFRQSGSGMRLKLTVDAELRRHEPRLQTVRSLGQAAGIIDYLEQSPVVLRSMQMWFDTKSAPSPHTCLEAVSYLQHNHNNAEEDMARYLTLVEGAALHITHTIVPLGPIS